MQMDDVCLLKLRQGGDVRTRVGYIDGKEIVFFEAVGFPDDDTFPYEFPYHLPVMVQRHDGYLVGLFVAHQQFSFDTVVLE